MEFEVQLTEAQARAVSHLDCHFTVTAGPGAGKTRVLVERFLRILETEHPTIDQIVALTFTNRAAHEMRDRLRARLMEKIDNAPASEQARWTNYKRTLDGAIITTIHGFCSRLLRDFPVEAGIDPQFTLLDEPQALLLLEQAAEQAVAHLIHSEDEHIIHLASSLGRPRLVAGVIEIYRQVRNQNIGLEELIHLTETHHQSIDELVRALAQLDGVLDEYGRMPGLSGNAQEARAVTLEQWPGLRERLRPEAERLSPSELEQVVLEFRAVRPAARGKLKPLVGEIDRLIWATDTTGLIPRLYLDMLTRPYALALQRLLCEVSRRFSEEKRRRQALDFDDLQLQALEMLRNHAEVPRRVTGRYKHFLIDEYQDTNTLQRDLLNLIAIAPAHRTSIFIVGDRKQSIYGFRGADVDVFRETSAQLMDLGGLTVALRENFRSQPLLIDFFNRVFPRVFQPTTNLTETELETLGFVAYEPGVTVEAFRPGLPPVEILLVDGSPGAGGSRQESGTENLREEAARQISDRIAGLLDCDVGARMDTGTDAGQITLKDIALLFRSTTHISAYEAALRRAGIPFITHGGRGFYQREEVRDLIQLLRFLDNRTDELALAAVLRSPLCGLSDGALLALRCGPPRDGFIETGRLRRRKGVRNLFHALLHHDRIDLIDDAEQSFVGSAANWLLNLSRTHQRMSISEILYAAIEQREYRAVAAANFDGAQRLANLDKLMELAGRFERSGARSIRDFVRYVEDFERARGREGEGAIDPEANAVRIMTIHQSKGLEFSIVIIPELHTTPKVQSSWCQVDRQKGLSLSIPNGRGRLLSGAAFERLRQRAALREQFESMRLLFVAATRAKHRLILSGILKGAAGVRTSDRQSWLDWIRNAIDSGDPPDSRWPSTTAPDVAQLTIETVSEDQTVTSARASPPFSSDDSAALPEEPGYALPLLAPLARASSGPVPRFTVTQLLNYQRCPRQFYFDRRMHLPGQQERDFWNRAEAPEPPANLTATLRGSVIHRFCELFREGDDPEQRLQSSFDEVVRSRESEWGDRIEEINREAALVELRPLAENYRSSDVSRRIEHLGQHSADLNPADPVFPAAGTFSERPFLLRTSSGILTGSIDKVMIDRESPMLTEGGRRLMVEVVDFKTNRITGDRAREECEHAAQDYLLQMQAYALAVQELTGIAPVRATLLFLVPNLEITLPPEGVTAEACREAINATMTRISSSDRLEDFPAKPAGHCRYCNFLGMCKEGRIHVFRDSERPAEVNQNFAT